MIQMGRILLGITLGAAVVLPYIAHSRGVGLSTERDAKLIEQAQDCPPEKRTLSGQCIITNRNVRARRSIFDGGPGQGK